MFINEIKILSFHSTKNRMRSNGRELNKHAPTKLSSFCSFIGFSLHAYVSINSITLFVKGVRWWFVLNCFSVHVCGFSLWMWAQCFIKWLFSSCFFASSSSSVNSFIFNRIWLTISMWEISSSIAINHYGYNFICTHKHEIPVRHFDGYHHFCRLTDAFKGNRQ